MIEADAIEQLKILTARQREVLGLVCQGNEYKYIGKVLFIDENTVKSHMANIYVKLDLTELTPALRRKILFETYCPALHGLDFAPKKDERIEPEPAPEEIIRMVENDERALVDVPPMDEEEKESSGQQGKRKPDKHEGAEKKRHPWRWLFVLTFLALFVFGGFQAYSWIQEFIGSMQGSSSQEEPETTNNLTSTAPKSVSTSVSSDAEAAPTMTAPPSPTKTPAAKVSLPFTDTFDSGFKSEWKPLSGSWITANGKLTAIKPDTDLHLIMLDDPTWTNYRVSVDVHINNYGAPSMGEFAIGVRALNTQSQFLGFFVDTLKRGGWAFLGSWHSEHEYLIGQGEVGSIPEDATYEIEVNGNEFVVRVNGREYQRINLSGYERGGILLGVECSNDHECPSFDNLVIEPIQ
jgi:hypothetical protein